MNLKGGVGKTVTAINMAAILASTYGQQVLLVDADSQANLTDFVTASLPPYDKGTAGGLATILSNPGCGCIIRKTSIPGVDLLPGCDELMDLDITKAGNGTVDIMALANLRARYEDDYGWMIIDCPPAFNAAAMAALIAADDVLIPLKLDSFSTRGLKNVSRQIRNMKRINVGLEIAGVLPTMFYRSAQQQEVESQIRATLKAEQIRCFGHIRLSPKVDEMTFAETPIIQSSPRSGAAIDYRHFVAEFMDFADSKGARARGREQKGGVSDGV